jgi:hypothetical protein
MIITQGGIMIREVFLGVRFLISLYFVLLALTVDQEQRGIFMSIIAGYFSLSAVVYFRHERLKVVNTYMDVPFLSLLILLSETPYSVFSLIPLIVLHTPRSTISALALLTAGILLTLRGFSQDPLELFSVLILLVTSPVSALIPDFLSAIKKEREASENIRMSYKRLMKDYARWERDRKELGDLLFLFECCTKNPRVEDFLKGIKEKYSVRRIHILPKRDLETETPYMDRERGILSVPVRLEDGNAVVIFEVENPFQLSDDLLVRSLERAGKMVSLYIEGFTDDTSLGRAINIG